ncbi:MAG: hypothetical protein ACK5V5_02485 [Cyclobacteriaceae bacterium]
MRSQFASSSWGGTRYPPFAFTEQGVAMLRASSYLPAKSPVSEILSEIITPKVA